MIYDLKTTYNTYKEDSLFGRYITLNKIEPLIHQLPKPIFKTSVIGQSVLNQPIYNIEVGTGKKRVLIWSQMHGNESTTTKALFDVFNFIIKNETILNDLTLSIVPILNPDGAKAYTRINANKIDLNRDTKELTQPESQVFKQHYETFKPHFGFNLHGQRTIFSAGKENRSATLSFLAPAEDNDRTVTETRQQSMRLIASLNAYLQTIIPEQIGRYDDGFNANCVGDTLTMLGIPTILFEAGHYNNDYNREEVRHFVFQSILKVLIDIKNDVNSQYDYKDYFKIPENEKLFCDVIIKNALVEGKIVDIDIQFEEYLEGDLVKFKGVIQQIASKTSKYAHKYIEANKQQINIDNGASIEINQVVNYVLINDDKILLISE